ncbi:hypothetical protein [Mesorhizobium sp.]|uniref:hypothetical protein n=1 Tax=Mesorhizobium sp. TaxID=1871066 RepID=UPI0025E4077C|nr:hypothetical protein [Mesorhizobium sp.]
MSLLEALAHVDELIEDLGGAMRPTRGKDMQSCRRALGDGVLDGRCAGELTLRVGRV